ncbi:MAG: TerB family tellurite resistance protein [Acidobacteria bacterium]|nr:TerB family tellurite resistance protein [Acidobacteriota bacterium]
MSIWKILGLPVAAPQLKGGADTEAVRKIVAALDQLEPQTARYLACFAYILGRVAHADLSISEEETWKMEQIVTEVGALSGEQSVIVVQMAKMQNVLFGGTENFLVTREFNKLANREQKLHLLHCLFAVSSADESISTAEASEIRQIGRELLLDDREVVAARSAYRDYLAVLKKPQESPGEP